MPLIEERGFGESGFMGQIANGQWLRRVGSKILGMPEPYPVGTVLLMTVSGPADVFGYGTWTITAAPAAFKALIGINPLWLWERIL